MSRHLANDACLRVGMVILHASEMPLVAITEKAALAKVHAEEQEA